ncbi:elongation factor P maturation arginine rhamnosyltransferase EarP [Orrella sp. JC864]|uniref:elongation factor P maturation arginine rhamnosyltransferase EarP n=1 Tax=Orrella sp. JC864 TaxID=3120298 RepID=UPI00300AE5D7
MLADIFCRVVDNYGDIGVCWRLARRLAQGRGWRVRLWVDALPAFAAIAPEVDPSQARQQVQGIELIRWRDPLPELAPGQVAIEAFACDPPADYVARMAGQGTVWINLEYLSAEDWVEHCHALPSPQAGGQRKFFFFPGFTPATGGLLREPGLIAQRDAWQADRGQAERLLEQRLGLSDALLQAWREGARLVTLFCYAHAPVQGLLRALARDSRPSVLLVPQGVAPQAEQALAASHCQTGSMPRLARIPFVDQPGFDRLLWSADLNLVRGEDSFVRALWAGRPMLWQIYPQAEQAHQPKLQAWLDRYAPPAAVRQAMLAWNRALPEHTGTQRAQAEAAFEAALGAALAEPAWAGWQAAAAQWTRQAARRKDLADALADFCENRAQTG